MQPGRTLILPDIAMPRPRSDGTVATPPRQQGSSSLSPSSLLAAQRRALSFRLRPSTSSAWLCVVVISSVTFFPIVVSGTLAVAIVTIAKQLGLSESEVQWPSAVLSLAQGALLLPAGSFADAFGRRATFIFGLTLYAISNLGTAFVNTGVAFIAMAAVQGIAIALLQPSAVGILSSSLPPSRMKNAAWSVFGASQPTGYAVGLIIGGLLAEQWQIVYYVVAAGSAAAVVLAHLVLPADGESLLPSHPSTRYDADVQTTRSDASALPAIPAAAAMPASGLTVSGAPSLKELAPTSDAKSETSSTRQRVKPSAKAKLLAFDWLGVLLSTSGLVLLTFALADAETRPQGFATPYIPALLPLSAILIGAFFFWERRLERQHQIFMRGQDNATPASGISPREPLVPPSIWKSSCFCAMLTTVFLVWLNFNSLPLFCSLNFQEVQGLSSVRTSIYFLTIVPVGIAANIIAGALVGRINSIWLVVVGSIGSAASALVFCITDPRNGYAKSMLPVLLFNAWPDLFFAPAQLYACTTVGPRHAALAGSLFSLTVRLSMSLGLAATSAVSTSTAKQAAKSLGISKDNPNALLKGYQAAGWLCFASSAAGLLIALLFLRKIGIVGSTTSLTSQGNDEERSRNRASERRRSELGEEIELATLPADSRGNTAATSEAASVISASK